MTSDSVMVPKRDKALAGSAGKYTNVPMLLPLISAAVAGTLSLALVFGLKGFCPYLYGLIWERGWVQFITVYAFWFSLGILFFKSLNIKREHKAFELDFIKNFTSGRETIGQKTFIGNQNDIEVNMNAEQKNLILVNRINKAIKQVKINRNPADVANVLSTVAEADAAIIDTSYILIKYMIWLIPVLGFIGTILGMTQAIGSFDAVLKGIGDVGFAGVKENLGSVTAGLAVAFDTTFLALVLSASINFFMNALQRKEENLLSDIEEFTTENIINKYTDLKNRIEEMAPASEEQPAKDLQGEDFIRELKNLNKQQNINTQELLTQLGRMIEAVEALPQNMPGKETQKISIKGLKELLEQINLVVTGQADFTQKMDMMADSFQKNAAVMEKLPRSIDGMKDAGVRLGELVEKIYNKER